MAYNGQSLTIPVGTEGLRTDLQQSQIPITSIILANNVSIRHNMVEKEPGSRRWNTSALPSPVVAAYDFWPDDITQRLIVVTKAGVVYKFHDPETSVTLKTGLVITDPPVFVAGGAEEANRARKLFLFTGNGPVQVLAGDGAAMTNLTTPPGDWATYYPTAGLIHRGRLIAFGNRNAPHFFYMSNPDDHENFTSNSLSFNVYPGEGEVLFTGYVFKGRLFVFKYPEGAYYLEDSDPDFVNWSVNKLTGSFGAASRHATIEVLNDLIVANSTGSLTSGQATQDFGDISTGDILNALGNESYMRQNMSQDGRKERQAVYYENKKLALFTYRSSGGIRNDRVLYLDFNRGTARVTWSDKDQPNCLFMRKDTLRIRRPFYGADDGYVYEMDREDRDVNGVAYRAEFQTPHMDLGFQDPGLANRKKLFDHLEITFEQAGSWDLSVDVYIDHIWVETVNFTQSKDSHLDEMLLDRDELDGRTAQAIMKPLHGTGRRISFRCYNSGLRQNFKITALTVYFRVAGDDQGAQVTTSGA